MTTDNRPFMPQRGNYRNLLVYQKAECIYDITFYFAHKYLEKGDRTIDQMVQAARSCKQNIAEGSAASTTSKETELKLTNVGRASLQELLADYEDYLPDRLDAEEIHRQAEAGLRGGRRTARGDVPGKDGMA